MTSPHGPGRPHLSRRGLLQTGAMTAGAIAFAAAASPWAATGTAQAQEGAADDGQLWLRYRQVTDPDRLDRYRDAFQRVAVFGSDRLLDNAEAEARRAVTGLTGVEPAAGWSGETGTLVIGTIDASPHVRQAVSAADADGLGTEGFAIRVQRSGRGVKRVVVAANAPAGVLYGVFHLIRLLQNGTEPEDLDATEVPSTELRMLNHWDNLDGSIERGYAGRSIFAWDALPEVTERMRDYARTTASIGVNASVLNNVNADAAFIDTAMLPKLAGLCDMLASWGISPWLSVNYASPILLTEDSDDPITTADPEDPRVQQWWQGKIAEIKEALPDLGGFLVKANSEGRPGPLDYGRTHADGANMLARAIAPDLIVWRSFVHEDFGDWAEYQHRVFAPLDGEFDDNVIVQTKYGPIDFQVREPVHPLFGALQNTNQMVELQITQEYTGQAGHAVFLAPMWREVLDFTTGGPGTGPTVAEITAAERAGLAGVSNFGDADDWTGYLLGAANSYAFGRLCWSTGAEPADLAAEWIRMTFGLGPDEVDTVAGILLDSWRTYEDYTSPLGMGYLSNPGGSHFDPDPVGTITQSHHSNGSGTGFDRTTATGSGFTGLYPEAWTEVYEHLDTVPDELLLFMHWVPYDHRLTSGSTVIQHLYDTHFAGVERVREFAEAWQTLAGDVDEERHAEVAAAFAAQIGHATTWRDAIVSFFFDLGRVLDDHRSWTQVAVPGERVLIGGWANRVAVDLTNASAEDKEITAGLVPAEGHWGAAATVAVAARETATALIPVEPPLNGWEGPADIELEPDGTALGNRGVRFLVAPAGQRCHLALDAGTDGSPVQPGYRPLTPGTSWSQERGYGWVSGPTPNGRDRNLLEPLTADLVGHANACTLRIAVPAGRHTARLLVGDRGARCRPFTIALNGTEVARTPELASGSFAWVDVELDGGDAFADLELDGIDDWWKLAALVIPDPDAPMPPVRVHAASAEPVWWTGGTHEVALTVANDGDAADVTVAVTVPEGWESDPVTVTLAAGSEQDVAVPVTAGPSPSIERLAVAVHANGVEIETGRLVEVVTAPDPARAALALDAGPDAESVLPGYRALTPESEWDAEAGYGWSGERPGARDRRNTDVLRRDLVVATSERTLDVAIPAGAQRVWILTGDPLTDSAVTVVSEGGTELGRSGPATLPARAMTWFSFAVDGGASGRTASLSLTGSGLNKMWRIAALAVVDPQ
ncbi:alpha-glucuronidase family glycosyl hydrolase [Glycomyces harbinensis]|uniref:Xylan alpha-1,2-glucuronidase n=1 Tax=Glycomyces harbinensis TaxID=58114 RepID=A0A1G7ARS3_9ACTN|nr:alpha-glucuronidase family glycosyl hydrolase [Glycomyces harbinensis]SDE17390.1 alpha-glucuronidase [Glycomyces harbinensis]